MASAEHSSETDAARERMKTGRNSPCPCGSGKKYKKCCLENDKALVRESSAARQPQTAGPAETVLPFSDTALDPFVDEMETKIPPEVQYKLDRLWDEFQRIANPTTEQLDAFLIGLLALPPEATSWSDLFHRFAAKNHHDLPAVFRRIAATVPHTNATRLGFFYWAAAEEFSRRGNISLLPEVAAGFRKLGRHSYDADALAHLEDFLLAAGCEAECLELAEHFLPIMRADDDLMPYAVPELCELVFHLRVGQCLRAAPRPEHPVELVAEELRRGMKKAIHMDTARLAAEVASGRVPAPVWSRAQFDLVHSNIRTDDDAWRECLRLNRMLMRVAWEGWQIEQRPPGCALHGLILMLAAAYDWLDAKRKTQSNAFNNLLDFLRPADLEERLVRACPDIIGVSEPRARLLLLVHDLLLRFAMRHQLICPADGAATEKALSRLQRELDGVPAQPPFGNAGSPFGPTIDKRSL